MSTAVLDFVITEHPPAITPGLERDYEILRGRIERLAGVPVRSRHYCDAGDFAAAVILSGSFAPWELHDPDSLARLGERLERFDGPVLGICGGMQLQTIFAGGSVRPRQRPAIGYKTVEVMEGADLLNGLGSSAEIYQHHSCDVVTLPDEFEVLACSEDCAVEAVRSRKRRWWGTQFHPERFSARRPDGARILRNFFALAGVGRQQGSREREAQSG
jgi:GMP synthase-like glutamine amidotransferase